MRIGAKNVCHRAKRVRYGAKNVRYGAENVLHCAENVRHGTLDDKYQNPVFYFKSGTNNLIILIVFFSLDYSLPRFFLVSVSNLIIISHVTTFWDQLFFFLIFKLKIYNYICF